MHEYERLDVWQLAYRLGLDVCRDVKSFPVDERFGMVQQMRRCATSVAANIAEGTRRITRGEFRHFLGIASGSNAELDVFLRFSADLGYMTRALVVQRRQTNERVHHMLRGLIISLGPIPRKTKEPARPLTTRTGPPTQRPGPESTMHNSTNSTPRRSA